MLPSRQRAQYFGRTHPLAGHAWNYRYCPSRLILTQFQSEICSLRNPLSSNFLIRLMSTNSPVLPAITGLALALAIQFLDEAAILQLLQWTIVEEIFGIRLRCLWMVRERKDCTDRLLRHVGNL